MAQGAIVSKWLGSDLNPGSLTLLYYASKNISLTNLALLL